MSTLSFRPLRADEVDCRVAMCRQNGVSLLLYKDARCDMNILDETVGPERWQRHHSRDNANCTVAIHFPEIGWVEKEDTGTESNTEAEKGLASDSFKRACFNWGIGRELYTAPFIWIGSDSCEIKTGQNGKASCYDRFKVTDMTVEAGKITSLTITNESRKGSVVYRYGQKAPQPAQSAQEATRRAGGKQTDKITGVQVKTLLSLLEMNGLTLDSMLHTYGLTSEYDMTQAQYDDAIGRISAWAQRAKAKREGKA